MELRPWGWEGSRQGSAAGHDLEDEPQAQSTPALQDWKTEPCGWDESPGGGLKGSCYPVYKQSVLWEGDWNSSLPESSASAICSRSQSCLEAAISGRNPPLLLGDKSSFSDRCAAHSGCQRAGGSNPLPHPPTPRLGEVDPPPSPLQGRLLSAQGGGGRRVPGSASQSSPSRAHLLPERRLSALDGSGLVPETERRRMRGRRGRRTREAAERGQAPSPAVLGGTSASLDSSEGRRTAVQL